MTDVRQAPHRLTLLGCRHRNDSAAIPSKGYAVYAAELEKLLQGIQGKVCSASASLITMMQATPTPFCQGKKSPCTTRMLSKAWDSIKGQHGGEGPCSTLYLKRFLAQVGHQRVGVGLAGSRHELVVPCRLQETLHVQVEAPLPARPLWLVALRDNLCAAAFGLSVCSNIWPSCVQQHLACLCAATFDLSVCSNIWPVSVQAEK